MKNFHCPFFFAKQYIVREIVGQAKYRLIFIKNGKRLPIVIIGKIPLNLTSEKNLFKSRDN
jgi:hypothetical protein